MDKFEKDCWKVVNFWKGELKLQEWEFQLSFNKDDSCEGYCLKDMTTKRAIININRDLNKEWVSMSGDLEFIILHELLHCVIYSHALSVESNKVWQLEREYCINTIANALLKGRRVLNENGDKYANCIKDE